MRVGANTYETFLICEGCKSVLGIVNDKIDIPMRGYMFDKPRAGFPQPFPLNLSAREFICSYCRKKPIWNDGVSSPRHEILTNKGRVKVEDGGKLVYLDMVESGEYPVEVSGPLVKNCDNKTGVVDVTSENSEETFVKSCDKNYDTEPGADEPQITLYDSHPSITVPNSVIKGWMCGKCGKEFKTEHGLNVHKGIKKHT